MRGRTAEDGGNASEKTCALMCWLSHVLVVVPRHFACGVGLRLRTAEAGVCRLCGVAHIATAILRRVRAAQRRAMFRARVSVIFNALSMALRSFRFSHFNFMCG
jgi:hypothetical protein